MRAEIRIGVWKADFAKKTTGPSYVARATWYAFDGPGGSGTADGAGADPADAAGNAVTRLYRDAISKRFGHVDHPRFYIADSAESFPSAPDVAMRCACPHSHENCGRLGCHEVEP